ncbi:hypothetical protein QJQ45_011060 [Haematococcus lacustris]|nr:hypothetical protein QJQ45_011060 [Haematococcus lacustris]
MSEAASLAARREGGRREKKKDEEGKKKKKKKGGGEEGGEGEECSDVRTSVHQGRSFRLGRGLLPPPSPDGVAAWWVYTTCSGVLADGAAASCCS